MNEASQPRRRVGRALGLGGACALLAFMLPSGALATPSTYLELDGNVVSDGTGSFDWANGGALSVNGSTYTRAGTGGVFDGGVFNGSTTPPTAPSRTSAAAGDATIAAAQFKVDPLSVDKTACGSGDPTAYTGAGSETNGDVLSTDTFGTASVPNKDDLSNVYALAHIDPSAPHPGGPAGDLGVNEVFFGAERVVNTGDSHIDFEFLQNKVSIPDACAGTFSGDRAQGDFLLSVDFTTGGNFGGITLYKWLCDLGNGGLTDHTKDGQVCNPVKVKGKVPAHYEVTGTDAVQINVNGHPNNDNSIENNIGCGGWACRNADGTATQQILTNELMEGGIDLKQLGFTGCLSTFLPHTRTSQSFTATLKDFEIIPFDTCAHPTITTRIADASGPLALDANGVAHVSLGAVLHDTAALHNTAGIATGSVTYSLYTSADCGGTATSLTPSPNALVNGVPPSSSTFTFNDAGTYYFKAAATFTDNRNKGNPDSGCNAEPVVVAPATPHPHSLPVVQVRDTFNVTGFSPNATGSVAVGLYTDSACTHRATGTTDTSFTIAQATAGAATSFVTVDTGTWYYKISYLGDPNNVGFNSCDEHADVTIVGLS